MSTATPQVTCPVNRRPCDKTDCNHTGVCEVSDYVVDREKLNAHNAAFDKEQKKSVNKPLEPDNESYLGKTNTMPTQALHEQLEDLMPLLENEMKALNFKWASCPRAMLDEKFLNANWMYQKGIHLTVNGNKERDERKPPHAMSVFAILDNLDNVINVWETKVTLAQAWGELDYRIRSWIKKREQEEIERLGADVVKIPITKGLLEMVDKLQSEETATANQRMGRAMLAEACKPKYTADEVIAIVREFLRNHRAPNKVDGKRYLKGNDWMVLGVINMAFKGR